MHLVHEQFDTQHGHAVSAHQDQTRFEFLVRLWINSFPYRTNLFQDSTTSQKK
jgi:hypothetical protein